MFNESQIFCEVLNIPPVKREWNQGKQYVDCEI